MADLEDDKIEQPSSVINKIVDLIAGNKGQGTYFKPGTYCKDGRIILPLNSISDYCSSKDWSFTVLSKVDFTYYKVKVDFC